MRTQPTVNVEKSQPLWAHGFSEPVIITATLRARPQDRFSNPRAYALSIDRTFCSFRIDAPRASGVYGWLVDGELVYLGRAASLRNRLSSQYGRVSPRHPFAGGQIQKCRINARIHDALAAGSTVAATWLVTPDYKAVERRLLSLGKPAWNVM